MSVFLVLQLILSHVSCLLRSFTHSESSYSTHHRLALHYHLLFGYVLEHSTVMNVNVVTGVSDEVSDEVSDGEKLLELI